MRYASSIVAATTMLLLSACGSSPVVKDRYYSLVLAANGGTATGNDEVTTASLIVGPIQLPTYLSGHGLPMQVGPNRIELAHHHFWAEPLNEAIAKVLTRDIAERTEGINVERDSGRISAEEDCRLRVEFDAFHPMSESHVVASGRYWIESSETSDRQAFSLTRTLTVDGYAHAVDELRGLLELLAEQISDDLAAGRGCPL